MNSIAPIDYIDPILTDARRVATELRRLKPTRGQMLNYCKGLLAGTHIEAPLTAFASKLSKLDTDARYYWIGTFYTLLLSREERSSQAAFFTPPHLARGLVDLARRQGFDPKRHTIIDPAAGGASFLSTIAGAMISAGLDGSTIAQRLHGYELDPELAALAEALLSDRIGIRVPKASVVEVKDSLKARPRKTYDLVIANPPYGRVKVGDVDGETWRKVCSPGHINKYALFAELSFRLASKGGLVVLVIPSSFIAGPLYGKLRSFIRENGEVLAVSSVSRRDDVFVDVAQDISVLVARAGTAHSAAHPVAFGTYDKEFKAVSAAPLPTAVDGAWLSQIGSRSLARGGATLSDYGAKLRAGYFVWNREGARMRTRRYVDLDVPLIWAKNIRPGALCQPQARKRDGTDFVHFVDESSGIIRTPAVVIQRTTNSSQLRRIVAARVAPQVIKSWGGFTSENHTIVLTGPQTDMLDALCFLLNSAAVDARYRLLSGTASVSVSLLRELDLPDPKHLQDAIARHGKTEMAVEDAYARSQSLMEVGA